MASVSEKTVDCDDLESRLRIILPKVYEDRYDDIQPLSMGSASLQYGPDGKVAWDSIWRSFCDLAMAGGPPHRGTLLEPGLKEEIEVEPDRYQEVVKEICRGVEMVTGLFVDTSPLPGWVRMYCSNACMAGWLTRALVTENISASFRGPVLYLPAGPRYRVEKEIKNVITAVAKSCHYWVEHTSADQHWEIAQLFAKMDSQSSLLQPPLFEQEFQLEQQQVLEDKVAQSIRRMTGLRCSKGEQAGWLALECENVAAAGWLALECENVAAAGWIMRMLVVSNVLSRREGTQVFFPVNSVSDSEGDRILENLFRVYGCASARKIL